MPVAGETSRRCRDSKCDDRHIAGHRARDWTGVTPSGSGRSLSNECYDIVRPERIKNKSKNLFRFHRRFARPPPSKETQRPSDSPPGPSPEQAGENQSIEVVLVLIGDRESQQAAVIAGERRYRDVGAQDKRIGNFIRHEVGRIEIRHPPANGGPAAPRAESRGQNGWWSIGDYIVGSFHRLIVFRTGGIIPRRRRLRAAAAVR